MNRSNPKFAFFLLVAISVLAAWASLASTFSLAWNDMRYTQILLILPVIAALMYLERPWPQVFSAANLRAGGGFLIASILLGVLAHWHFVALPPDQRLALNMLALILWWMGAFILCFGPQAAWRLLFPLGFLLGLVPWPTFLLDWVVSGLQQWSAFCARILFTAYGIPVSQDGVFLTIPGLTLEVAQECSSIRSSLMLLVTTMVLTQLLLRAPWRKAIVVAAVIPLSVAKNGLRIFTIGTLGTRVDPAYLTGRLHREGGVIFFLIALVGIALLLWILQRGERHPAAGPV
jgi:exosortase